MPLIKKEQMLPGTKLKVRDVIKDGVTISIPGLPRMSVMPAMRLMREAGSMLDGVHAILSGTILEVVDKPRLRHGINTIIVRTPDGIEGHVYWCEMRASADIV